MARPPAGGIAARPTANTATLPWREGGGGRGGGKVSAPACCRQSTPFPRQARAFWTHDNCPPDNCPRHPENRRRRRLPC